MKKPKYNLIAFVLPTHLPGMGGWGNGYVALPRNHPYFKKYYNSIDPCIYTTTLWHRFLVWVGIKKQYRPLEVHGGLTFSESSIVGQPKETEGMWILGFDTLHWNDTPEKWPDEASVMVETQNLLNQLMQL